MFNSVRSTLLTIIVSFVLITFSVSIIAFNSFNNSKDSLSEITVEIAEIYILLLEDVKITHEFFEKETINPSFFLTGKSAILDDHYETCRKIESAIKALTENQERNNFQLKDSIQILRNNFEKYRSLNNQIVRKIFVRGFKDYGVEGKMRRYAHELENYGTEIGLSEILQLRRHEKDFILRQEDQYIFKYTSLINQMKNSLAENSLVDPGKKKTILDALNKYADQFNSLASFEKKIGLKSHGGLKTSIDKVEERLKSTFAAIRVSAAETEKSGLLDLKIVFVFIGFIFILLSILIALYISKRLSFSITNLKKKIEEFMDNDFTVRTIFPVNDSNHEIAILTNNFGIMQQHILNQINALRQTNKEFETLLYRSSHDIKSPLATVKGLTNLACSEISDPVSKRYFSMINLSWHKLNMIVDELGMIADIKTDQFSNEIINFEELIKSVYQDFNSVDKFEDIVFSSEINLKEPFYSYKRLITNVLKHLIENAIKYSVKRNGHSFIKISVATQSGNMLKIVVSDNGLGIKKDYHEKIFDMFFRGTALSSGTGLGLYIVQNSVQKLNGEINFESEEGKGTKFTILLPNNMLKKTFAERIIQKRVVLNTPNITFNIN